jgi:hypothetical protein
MTTEWTCIYCGKHNPFQARFCINCSAKIPDLKYSTSTKEKKTADESEEKPDQTEKKYDKLDVPDPGSLVGSLFVLCESVLNDQITPSEFGSRIRKAIESIDPVFGAIYDGISTTETDGEEYRDQVLTLLENVQFMFVKALEELLLFEKDQAPYHIRFGRMLAQRAEMEYIQIIEMLVYDAKADCNPFEGAPFVLGNLAEDFYIGRLSLQGFKEKLTAFEKTTNNYLKRGNQLLKNGFALAAKFDGTDGEILQAAIDKLAEAGDEISKAIINLHTRKEIEGSIKQIAEKLHTPEKI